MLVNLGKYDVVLASGSPRRHALIKELGFNFRIETRAVEEIFPPGMKNEDIAIYLSNLKASAFEEDFFKENTMLITADTIVCASGEVLGKPASREEAYEMISLLSGKMHQVITGMSIKTSRRQVNFAVYTDVYFKELSSDEIYFYIDRYKPFDKAGAYGIQEWIGYIGIERINGSFYNVMGLPVFRLYEELLKF